MSFITVTLNASIDRTGIIHNFQTGKINRLDQPKESPGGKGLNVTRVLKTFNENVTATGFIGGKYGEKLKSLMDEEGFNHEFQKINGETRFCLAIIDPEHNKITELNENGPQISDEELNSFYDKYRKISPDAEFSIISGSVPKSLPYEVYFELIELSGKRNLKTALDASGKPLKEGIKAKPFIIKPNKNETEELVGFELNTEEDVIKATRYLSEYCNISCITLEDKGAFLCTKNEIYQFIPPQIKVVNSVGSGDSFLAGLVYGIKNNFSLSDSGKWAISAGTANALTEKAGFCNIYDINRIYNEVIVKRLV